MDEQRIDGQARGTAQAFAKLVNDLTELLRPLDDAQRRKVIEEVARRNGWDAEPLFAKLAKG